jgi:large subunit ribosomal protein L18e
MKNNVLKTTIASLKSQEAALWKRVGKDLAKPTRIRRSVNLTKLNACAQKENIVVPGKVLGTGSIEKALTVVAYQFSETAKKKILAAGGSVKTITQEVADNPKGANLRIIG